MMTRGLLILLGLSTSQSAVAFVENVGHGYQSCRVCHVSPSGGGVLTEYGRSLSRELMSTWGPEGFENVGFGLIANPEHENFRIGGDLRSVQTYINNDMMEQSRYFLMQQNIELALNAGKIWFVSTFGTQEGPKSTKDRGTFLSERHYVLWTPTDALTVRLGQFRVNHGLNDPNHTRPTKARLGFGALSETTLLEVGLHQQKSEWFVSLSPGDQEAKSGQVKEKLVAVSYGHYLGERAKVGASFLYGNSKSARRELFGIWGVSEFGRSFLVLGEVDYQMKTIKTADKAKTPTLVGHLRLAWTGAKGFLPYILSERTHVDYYSDAVINGNGVGIQWMPLPHFEFQVEYQRLDGFPLPKKQSDSVFAQFHFYL